MDLTKVAIDTVKEVEGIWFNIDGETSILVARMYNPNFNKLFEKESAPYRSTAKRGLLGNEKAEQIMSKVIASTVLLDWKGLQLNGEDLPYNTKNCIEILTNIKYAPFKQLVIDFAEDQANYREEAMNDDIKKSKTTLSGNASGAKT